MKRLILALALICSLIALTLPAGSQGLVVVQRRAASSTAPLPSFSNVVAAYSVSGNYDPAGYPELPSFEANARSCNFTAATPYPPDYANFIDGADPSPYLATTWNDQTQVNDLTASGAARPTLQITTPIVVSGAGTSAANGTPTYFNQTNSRAAYVYSGSDPTADGIYWTGTAWRIRRSSSTLYASSDDVAFPWLATTWDEAIGDSPAPTVAASTQKGEIQFDGTATGLATSANVTLGVQVSTFYIYFKAGSLVETSVLFETGSGAAANKGAISVRMVAGVLTVSVSDQTAVVALLNTKIKTISDSNWHLLSVVIDTTAAVNANQVLCWLDGSNSGWTSSISTDLSDENLTTAKFNFGARNNAASAFFTGSVTDFPFFSVAQNNTLRGQWEAYITSLHP